MDDNGTDYEWEGEDYAVYPEQTDFTFDFEQQSQMGLGTDKDEFFIDGLMGGGIGPWKVSLSAQGLRDLKQSRSEGMYLYPSILPSLIPPTLPSSDLWIYPNRGLPIREPPTYTWKIAIPSQRGLGPAVCCETVPPMRAPLPSAAVPGPVRR